LWGKEGLASQSSRERNFLTQQQSFLRVPIGTPVRDLLILANEKRLQDLIKGSKHPHSRESFVWFVPRGALIEQLQEKW
jgi:hypothetical protein